MTTTTIPTVSYPGAVRITGQAQGYDGPEWTTEARDRAAADRRLAALADELAARDDVAFAERETKRPIVWLTAMTIGAVLLANLAIVVAVAGTF